MNSSMPSDEYEHKYKTLWRKLMELLITKETDYRLECFGCVGQGNYSTASNFYGRAMSYNDVMVTMKFLVAEYEREEGNE